MADGKKGINAEVRRESEDAERAKAQQMTRLLLGVKGWDYDFAATEEVAVYGEGART